MFVDPFTSESWHFMASEKKPLGNPVGKRENAGNQHFLLFSQCFLSFYIGKFNFLIHNVSLYTTALKLEEPEILPNNTEFRTF